MRTKVRAWHLVVILVTVAGAAWAMLPSAPPPPPDFTSGGFTSIRIELKRFGEELPAVSATSDDPAVVAELAEIVRTGRSVVVCRCAALGTLEFRRPDGTTERVLLMPAHEDDSVEFRAGKGRYQVDRAWFLRVVGPLGLPAARWFSAGN